MLTAPPCCRPAIVCGAPPDPDLRRNRRSCPWVTSRACRTPKTLFAPPFAPIDVQVGSARRDPRQIPCGPNTPAGTDLTNLSIQWSKVEYSGAKWRTADLCVGLGGWPVFLGT